MPTSERFGTALGGPSSGSASYFGEGSIFDVSAYVVNASQSAPVNTATSEQVIALIPGLSPCTPEGIYTDALPSSGVIANLNQVRIATGGVALGANLANSTISFFLRRAGAVVGGGAFAGWAAAGNPAIAAYSSAVVPFLPANTALVAPRGQAAVSSTLALLPLQPGDVITLSVVTTGAVTMPFLFGFLDWT